MYPSDLFVTVKLPAAVVRRFKSRTAPRTPTARVRFDERVNGINTPAS